LKAYLLLSIIFWVARHWFVW